MKNVIALMSLLLACTIYCSQRDIETAEQLRTSARKLRQFFRSNGQPVSATELIRDDEDGYQSDNDNTPSSLGKRKPSQCAARRQCAQDSSLTGTLKRLSLTPTESAAQVGTACAVLFSE